MNVKVRLFSLTQPAADGSMIGERELTQYLESNQYREDVENRTMLGGLSHRLRSIENAPESIRTGMLSKTIGKDDLLVFCPEIGAPTHYIERLYIEDGWCMADIHILDEDGADDVQKQHILRLKSMLRQGIKPGISSVIVAYWSGNQNGTDICKKLIRCKGADWTHSPSWKSAGCVEIFDDEGERLYSDHSEGICVKTFSNVSEIVDSTTPKTSKIDGCYTVLKGKVFSNFETEVIESENTIEEKQFSVAEKKERVRMAKFPPRQRFRRLIMEYKALVKSMGGVEKIEPETLKVMKSLFSTDLLDLMKTVTPDVMQGKQLNTLLGASSLGKDCRVIMSKINLPLKMALQQASKSGYVTKNIYEKVQALYVEMVNSLIDVVFSSKSTIPDLKEGEEEEGSENKETK